MKIVQKPSPNFSYSNYIKSKVMLHKTLGDMPGCLNWLRNPKSKASAHYLVTKDGTIYQLVQLKDRSWTAGVIRRPTKRGKSAMIELMGEWVKPGYYMIEIEVECLLHETYTEEQYKALTWLIKTFNFPVYNNSLITHQDTCWYKPNLEKERTEILNRLRVPVTEEEKKKMQELIVVLINKVLQLYKQLILLKRK